MPDTTTIIVGLGNPGPRFAGTRHNVGWRVLDLVSQQLQVPINERRPKAVLGTGFHGGRRVVLAKPRTFMNNSGEAVEYLQARFGGDGNNLLIIYDEMALLPGRIRLRASGSDAGHNGIRSIIQAVGGTGFPRLRVGIGGPPPGMVARDYVLGKFDDKEADAIAGAVDRSAAAVRCLLTDGIATAMNQYNQDPADSAGNSDTGVTPPPHSSTDGAPKPGGSASPDRPRLQGREHSDHRDQRSTERNDN